jgi:hypothetical protein
MRSDSLSTWQGQALQQTWRMAGAMRHLLTALAVHSTILLVFNCPAAGEEAQPPC